MRKVNKKQIISIIFPVVLLLGIVAAVAVPKGSLLKASTDEVSFVNITKDGKDVNDLKVADDRVNLQITAKEAGIYELPYDESQIILGFPKVAEEKVSYSEASDQDFKIDSLTNKESKTESTSASSTTESTEAKATKDQSEIHKVISSADQTKGTYYLKLQKGQKISLEVYRAAEVDAALVLKQYQNDKNKQTMVTFTVTKAEEKVVNETNTVKEDKEAETTKDTSKSETKEKAEATSKADSDKASNDEVSKQTEQKTDTKEDITKEEKNEKAQQAPEKEQAKDPKENDEDAGKNILKVETKETKEQLDSLKEKVYPAKLSLKTPLLLDSSVTKSAKALKAASANPDVIVRGASMTINDGVGPFDADNNPGHDTNASNGIVRSFDQIIYLVSFTIQNNTSNANYSNIKYQVNAQLPNAVTMKGNVPQMNAEIANGTMYNADGTTYTGGAGYSEGIMQSSISTTGQIFVPVVVNVFAAPNGMQFTPTFQVKLLTADKTDGDNQVTKDVPLNETYDSSSLAGLGAKTTTVSSKASVGIKLVAGENYKDSDASKILNQNWGGLQALDVASVAEIRALDEHKSWANKFVGATFPTTDVNYTISYSLQSKKDGNLSNENANRMFEVSAIAYAGATNVRPTSTSSSPAWQVPAKAGSGIGDTTVFEHPLPAPNAYTNQLYNTEPDSSVDKTKIGVYNSGNYTVSNSGGSDGNATTNVTVSGYASVYNPYTYNMTGAQYSMSSGKPFASLETILRWDQGRTLDYAKNNNWNQFFLNISVNKVNYDGADHSNSSTINYQNNYTPVGIYYGGISLATIPSMRGNSKFKLNDGKTIEGSVDQNDVVYTNPNTTLNQITIANQVGNMQLLAGQNVYAISQISNGWPPGSSFPFYPGTQTITMWDPSFLSYDDSRTEAIINQYKEPSYAGGHIEYGIAKDPKTAPPTTMKVQSEENTAKMYTWYTTPAEAKKNGAISAVRFMDVKTALLSTGETYHAIPLTVNANLSNTSKTPGGYGFPAGNPLVIMGTLRFTDNDEKTTYDPFVSDPHGFPLGGDYVHGTGGAVGTPPTVTYKPSTFDSNGTVTSIPNSYYNIIGDTGYIKAFGITTSTDVEKPTYMTDQKPKVKLRGYLSGSTTVRYDGKITTTLPAGITYNAGSAVDGYGSKLTDPTITTSNGQQVLTWTYTQQSSGQQITSVSLKNGIEVNFDTSVTDVAAINFDTTGFSKALTVNTVGEMWQSGNPTNNDKAIPTVRSSSDTFTVSFVQQVPVTKTLDKEKIETGNVDAAISGGKGDTSISYTVKASNNSTAALANAKMLDVLPYVGDNRGTATSGSYTVTKVTSKNKDDVISFTTQAVTTDLKPNDVSGWQTYTTGTDISKATAFMVTRKSLTIGQDMGLTVTIQPTGQTGGDVFANNAIFDSDMKLPVNTQTVKTKVYERQLSGLAWFDDNANGIKDPGEPVAPNIPVYIVRSSQDHPDYQPTGFLQTDLTGKKLVDDNKASLVKTDANGNYQFDNLPEGVYTVAFDVADGVRNKLYTVTKRDPVAESQLPNTSKADQKNFTTYNYDLDSLLTGNWLTTSKKVENINIGLVRSGGIRLFKYETGTATDANGDGKLSDAEKQTGKALAGATFELRQGDNKIATKTTGPDGWLSFDNVPTGDYTLVETQAPDGHELLKQPIKVTVTQSGQTVLVYADNQPKTELPHAGGNNPLVLTLIIASSIAVLGFGFMLFYYRPSKGKGSK